MVNVKITNMIVLLIMSCNYADDSTFSTENSDSELTNILTTSDTTNNSTDITTNYSTGESIECGNNIIEEGEECDDHSFRCAKNCQWNRLVFVTSTDIMFDGFHGDFINVSPDESCNTIATIANLQLENENRFTAWISFTEKSVVDRFRVKSTGPYLLFDGTLVANNFDDLLDGEIQNPILLNEYGEEQYGDVWTGTNFDGSIVEPNCNNWTSSGIFDSGIVGDAKFKTFEWTISQENNGERSCGAQRNLYCFEDLIETDNP